MTHAPPQDSALLSAPAADLHANPDLQEVPRGAFALAGAAVGLLIAAWLLIYFFVFLARGPVG